MEIVFFQNSQNPKIGLKWPILAQKSDPSGPILKFHFCQNARKKNHLTICLKYLPRPKMTSWVDLRGQNYTLETHLKAVQSI